MRITRHPLIAAGLCALLSLGTFGAPWGLASIAGSARSTSTTQFTDQARDIVYWDPEPEAPDAEILLEPPAPVPPEPVPESDASEVVDDTVPAQVGDEDGIEPTLAAVADQGTVVRTRRRTVTDARAAARRKRALKARKRRLRRMQKCKEPHPSVRVGQDGVVEVEKAYVDAVTKNLKAFMELGYSRPHDEDGVKGWYISGFGCTSPVHKAGFRRRDVLLRVNGKKTRSWAGVFLLYQKLKRKSEFQVELLRREEPVTLQFRIVEPWSTPG